MKGIENNGHYSKIEKNTTLKGNIKSKTDIRIDGSVEGEVITTGKVILGKESDVIGKILCGNADVEGKFELFGLRFLNQSNGICYHSIGVNGASVPSYLRCENLSDDLSMVSPDLIIFSVGINDAYEPSFSKEVFKSNYDSIIQLVKQYIQFNLGI